MLYIAKFIQEKWEDDEFATILVQGPNGYGKTTYANKGMAENFSIDNGGKPDWEKVKKRIGYTPDEVLLTLNKIPKGKKWKVYHWDDAGAWLHSLDFQDPFVKAVGKYMQLARTDLGCMIFTTIDIKDLSSKIRGIKNAIIVDITKDGKSEAQPFVRTARAYILQETFKGRIWRDYQWEERFNCHVPDSFYRWYKPIRDEYALIAKSKAREKWLERQKREKLEQVKIIELADRYRRAMKKIEKMKDINI